MVAELEAAPEPAPVIRGLLGSKKELPHREANPPPPIPIADFPKKDLRLSSKARSSMIFFSLILASGYSLIEIQQGMGCEGQGGKAFALYRRLN